MKTNQVLTRKMGEFDVLQRTSDGYFDGNALLAQWNKSNKRRRMDDFLESVNTKEFIEALIDEENHRRNFSIPDFQIVIKGRAITKSNGQKIPASIWMHPYLFIKFAMWINPRFEVKVIRFVYDELIKYRNDAGDAYREMSSSVSKIVDKEFMATAIKEIAKALNHIVFGRHESGMRNNNAEENRMKELFELERKIASLIDEGFITSYPALINYLRGLWIKKWQPPVLSDRLGMYK